jgi:hypothetical protein
VEKYNRDNKWRKRGKAWPGRAGLCANSPASIGNGCLACFTHKGVALGARPASITMLAGGIGCIILVLESAEFRN